MMRKLPIYILIGFVSISFTIINYYYHYDTVWGLLFVPAVSIVFLHPKWKTVLITGISFNLVVAVIEFIIFSKGYEDFEGLPRLLSGAFVGWMIYLFISFLMISNFKLTESLNNLSLTDPLTNSYNRRFLELYIEKTLPVYSETDRELTVIMFDIDFFKKINDNYGHSIGDLILKRVTFTTTRLLRKYDVLIRTGGEEFLILLPETNLEQGVSIALRINEAVKIDSIDIGVPVTLSMGVEEYSKYESFDLLLQEVDKKVYRAKENGRNQVIYT